jgi:hypothetical protein
MKDSGDPTSHEERHLVSSSTQLGPDFVGEKATETKTQAFNRGRFKELSQCQIHTECDPQAHHELHTQEGVSSRQKKVVF